jgi:hypothetical protein
VIKAIITSPEFVIFVLSEVIAVSVGAGGMWFLIREMRKQLNGVGRKYGKLQTALLVFCPEEKREKIADLLK